MCLTDLHPLLFHKHFGMEHLKFKLINTFACYKRNHIFSPMAQKPPNGPESRHCRGFTITFRHTTVGRTPLDEWSARRTDNTQHSQQTDIHAPGGIQTHNPSKRSAADPRLRPRGHRDRHITITRTHYLHTYICHTYPVMQ